MRPWFIRPVVLLGVLSLLTFISVYRDHFSTLVNSRTSFKLNHADQVSYYEINNARHVRFRMMGEESSINLITHLVLHPPYPVTDESYDPNRVYHYGLILTLRDSAGQEIWTREVHTTTRQSKAEYFDYLWTHENSFSLEPGVQITDDRVFRINLPRDIPVGAELEIQLVSSHSRTGLVRAYRVGNRDLDRKILDRYSISPTTQHHLLEKLTYLAWPELNEHQQSARLRFERHRLAAQDQPDQKAVVRSIFVTGFRRIPNKTNDLAGQIIEANQPLAYVVNGPAEIEIDVTMGSQAPSAPLIETEQDPQLLLQSIDTQANEDLFVLATPVGAQKKHTVSLPTGAHTLIAYLDGSKSAQLTLRATGIHTVQLASNSLLSALDEPKTETLSPTYQYIPMYLLGKNSPSIDYQILDSLDLESSILKIDVRGIGNHSDTESFASLSYEFLDDQDNVLLRDSWRGELIESPFEHIKQTIPNSTEPLIVSTTESTGFRTIAPLGSKTLRITSDNILAVSVSTYFDPKRIGSPFAPPFDTIELSNCRWRYAPMATRRWHRLLPMNHYDRIKSLGLTTLVAQLRLESTDFGDIEDESLAPTTWDAVHPLGNRERQEILEYLTENKRDIDHSSWKRGTYSKISQSTNYKFVQKQTSPRPPKIRYYSKTSKRLTNRRISFEIDDKTFVKRLAVTRGQFVLPRLSPGEHSFRIVDADPSLLFFIDQSLAFPQSTPVFRKTTVYKLGRNGLRISVNQSENQSIVVNARIFRVLSHDIDIPPLAPRIRIAIDGGKPKRTRGIPLDHITVSEREFVLRRATQPGYVVFLDRNQLGNVEVYQTSIILGQDLQAGTHKITITSEDGSTSWARFFMRGHRQSTSSTRQWDSDLKLEGEWSDAH